MSSRRMAPVIAAAVLALTSCGPSAGEFRDTDPNGYAACQSFGEAEGAGGDVYRTHIGAAAERGLEATTDAIRLAVDDQDGGAGGDPVIRDLSAFRDACKQSGYNF